MRSGLLAGPDFFLDVLDQANLGPSRWLNTAREQKRARGFYQGSDIFTRTAVGAPLVVAADVGKTIGLLSQGKVFEYDTYKHLLKYPFGHFAFQALIKRMEEDK